MPLTILVVEDDLTVADALRDTLESEGWRVRVCADAITGHEEIQGGEHYDLLLLDNRLPGEASGVELIRFARGLGHRRQTPVVMFSASNVEGEARAAGADAFLRKPEDFKLLLETVEGLVKRER